MWFSEHQGTQNNHFTTSFIVKCFLDNESITTNILLLKKFSKKFPKISYTVVLKRHTTHFRTENLEIDNHKNFKFRVIFVNIYGVLIMFMNIREYCE